MKSCFLFLCCVLFACHSVIECSHADTSGTPIEITADESLEWLRNDLIFRATKNVKVKQSDTTLHADSLTAKYREKEQSGIDIYEIIAKGNVRIVSPQGKVYGARAVYDASRRHVVMTGGNLRLVSDGQTVTARDKFTYDMRAGRVEAIGRAVAVRGDDKLTADKITAIFTRYERGKNSLKTLQAKGQVVITTPDEVISGDDAIYDAGTKIAEIKGRVKITRGQNILEGTRATVNLETNVSQIFGGQTTEQGNGRVRGVFYPQSAKSSDEGQ